MEGVEGKYETLFGSCVWQPNGSRTKKLSPTDYISLTLVLTENSKQEAPSSLAFGPPIHEYTTSKSARYGDLSFAFSTQISPTVVNGLVIKRKKEYERKNNAQDLFSELSTLKGGRKNIQDGVSMM